MPFSARSHPLWTASTVPSMRCSYYNYIDCNHRQLTTPGALCFFESREIDATNLCGGRVEALAGARGMNLWGNILGNFFGQLEVNGDGAALECPPCDRAPHAPHRGA